jgi:hypothetical protein
MFPSLPPEALPASPDTQSSAFTVVDDEAQAAIAD